MRRAVPLLALLLTAPAAHPAAKTPQFSGSVQVIEVEVPVEGGDREGNPVRGLTRKDFRLYDQGRQQQIEHFQVIDLRAAATGDPPRARRPTPRPKRRESIHVTFSCSST